MEELGGKEAQALQQWGIEAITEPPTQNADILEFADKWFEGVRDGGLDDVAIFERDLNPSSPDRLAAWMLTSLMRQQPKPSYIYVISGLDVIGFSRDEEKILEQRQRISSAAIIWINEISASELSNAERNKLFQFLTDLNRAGKTSMITCSITVDMAFEWVGPVVGRLFEKRFRVLAV